MTPLQCIYELTGCCFREIWIHSLFRCLACFCGAQWQCASLSWGDVIREEIKSKEQAWPTVQLLCCCPQGCREELAADTELKWAENRSVRDSSLVTGKQRFLTPSLKGAENSRNVRLQFSLSSQMPQKNLNLPKHYIAKQWHAFSRILLNLAP